MFDVGQKVICVRKEPWALISAVGTGFGPAFGAECTIDSVIPAGTIFRVQGRVFRSKTDMLDLAEWLGSSYEVKWFRPKEPNIEALRSLLVSKKQSEKV